MEGVVKFARDPRGQVELEGTWADFSLDDERSGSFGCQWVFRAELVSGVFCCADEDQIFYMESVCLDVFVGPLHVPVLVFAEDL